MPQLEEFLWYFGLVLASVVLARLFTLRLMHRYPALCWCMGLQLLRAVPLLALDVNTNAYARTYMATLPVLLVSYVCAALEIYAQAFGGYRGLFVVSRRVMLGVLAASAIAAILVHLGELEFAGEQFRVIRAVLLIESAVYLMLLIFLSAIAAFLIWYPAIVRKNLLLYSFSFSLYMAAQCAAIFLRNSDPTGLTRIASMTKLALEDLSLLAIAVVFRASWEIEERPSVTNLTNAHKQRLLSQLNQLNAALEQKGKSTPAS